MQRLEQLLHSIDGKGYPQYKRLKGHYEFEQFDLWIDHVQGDPFAAPSKLSIVLSLEELRLSEQYTKNRSRRIGTEDGILRDWARALSGYSRSRGSGKSGQWAIHYPGQQMLPRTACEIDRGQIRLRFTLGLPALGRRILAREAEVLLLDDLPRRVHQALYQADKETWLNHAKVYEDQDYLRQWLIDNKKLFFIANGSVLPRESGVSDRPMSKGAIPWQSPKEWETSVSLPNYGKISGTTVSQGVHLICGGGYHGKSTLLQAISRGVYNHIPGDGREWCVTHSDAVSVRAEDGRSVSSADISAFISNLPNKQETSRFVTSNASGSTSQAANIVEALELGCECLLIDEDTSATNFMMRDRRMQELIHTDREPITPFIDRIAQLQTELEISSLLVIGGSGDYFEVCDSVLVMENYCPRVETRKAKSIVDNFPSQRLAEKRAPIKPIQPRIPNPSCFDPSRGRREERVRTQSTRSLTFGKYEVDLAAIGQLIDSGQTKTIGDWLIQLSRGAADGQRSILELCQMMEKKVLENLLSETLPSPDGDRVFVRRYEMAAAINRLRVLEIIQ